METASDQGEEGKKICIEVIERLRETDGVAGCHVMAVAWEESVPEILERAGLHGMAGAS
jgi:methylenetetrahydrofolate reductase (NADPH)